MVGGRGGRRAGRGGRSHARGTEVWAGLVAVIVALLSTVNARRRCRVEVYRSRSSRPGSVPVVVTVNVPSRARPLNGLGV